MNSVPNNARPLCATDRRVWSRRRLHPHPDGVAMHSLPLGMVRLMGLGTTAWGLRGMGNVRPAEQV